MMNRRLVWAGMLLLAHAAVAADVRVTPVRVILSAAAPIASMHIENAGADELLMQLRLVKWSQHDGQDLFEPTSDVIANPPEFRLAPGADQIVRFGLEAASGAEEKSYRVFIDQVPRAEDAKANQVQTVLRISVPVFVPGEGAAPHLTWSLFTGSSRSILRATNSGTAHIEVDAFVLRDGAGKVVATVDRPAYLLAGQTHEWSLAPALHPGRSVKLEAQTDRQPVAENLTVASSQAADVAAHP